MAVEKKKIFEIEIPAIRQHIQAISFTKAELEGKLVKMDMTRMLKGKNLEANFMIKKKDDNLIGEFFSLNLLLSYIRRMMRKNISWIEDSFSCKSKDEKLRIKPFLISRKKIHRSVKAALRNKARELIIEYSGLEHLPCIF